MTMLKWNAFYVKKYRNSSEFIQLFIWKYCNSLCLSISCMRWWKIISKCLNSQLESCNTENLNRWWFCILLLCIVIFFLFHCLPNQSIHIGFFICGPKANIGLFGLGGHSFVNDDYIIYCKHFKVDRNF